jgi:hypothetical protein
MRKEVEEHTEEHSDGHTWTSGSNTHTEQHGTPLDGRGTGRNTCVCVSPETATGERRGAERQHPNMEARVPQFHIFMSDLWSLKTELAAARAENEMLLRQLTRLCVFVEQTTGRDPIEIMHTDDVNPQQATPVATAAAAAAGRAAAAAGVAAAAAVEPESRDVDAPDNSWGGWFRSMLGEPELAPAELPFEPGVSSGEESEVSAGANDSGSESGAAPEEEVNEGSLFVWCGDADDVELLDAKLHTCRGITAIRLDGGSLARLPASTRVWSRLASTLTSLSLDGNAIIDLPAAVGRCQLMRNLSLERNLLRALPAPVRMAGSARD